MISINGIKNEYIIDLSESVDSKYVLSTDSNDSINISYVSNSDAIYAYIFEKNNISIEVDKKKLTKEGVIILKDLRKNIYKMCKSSRFNFNTSRICKYNQARFVL